MVWHRMGGRKDQGPEGRRRLGRTCGHEKRVGGQGGGKGQLEMDSLLEAGTESPHANWGGAVVTAPGPCRDPKDQPAQLVMSVVGPGGGDRCLLRILWLLDPQRLSV